MSDYYDILGIDKDADIKDIRKAYKKLAFKWHPDKNPDNKENATKNFKAISQAYQTLSDPDKRQKYDMFGGSDTGSEFSIDPFDLFSKLFGENNSFAFDMFKPTITRILKNSFESPPSPSIYHDLYCTLEDLYYGKTKKIRLTRTNYCTNPPTIESEIKQIHVLPGWKDGTKLTFNGEGDIHPHMQPSNVVIIIKTQIHSVYEKIGYDLYIDCNISLYEALNGFTRMVPTIKNTKETVTMDRLDYTREKFLLKGHGMPVRKNKEIIGYGDLIVRFVIVLNNIDKSKKELISSVLKY